MTRREETRADGPASGCYAQEMFGSGMGAVVPVRGQWKLAAESLEQTDAADVGPYARVTGVSAIDYRVEALLSVSSFKQSTWASGVYVLVGLRTGADPSRPGYYACGVSPNYGLVIGECQLGQPLTACWQLDHLDLTIVPAQPYWVQATIAGSTLVCALPDLGKALTRSVLLDGGPGLATTYASGSFDNLKVCAP